MQQIGNITREHFLIVAEEVMKRFRRLPENSNPEGTGGFMAVMDKYRQTMLFVNELGICHSDLAERCFGYCQEKVRRLLDKQPTGHISGWQSRDPDLKQYGGAIAAPSNGQGLESGKNLIGAISGLSEHGDEVVTLVIWMIFRWIMLSEAKEIIKISQNPFLDSLLQSCNDLFDQVDQTGICS